MELPFAERSGTEVLAGEAFLCVNPVGAAWCFARIADYVLIFGFLLEK